MLDRGTQKNLTTRLAFFLLLGVLFVITARMVVPYILAVITGAILAILAKPAYNRLRDKGFRPKSAAALVTIAILLLIIGPLSWFASLFVQQGIQFGQYLSQQGSFNTALQNVSSIPIVKRFVGDSSQVQQQINSSIRNIGTGGSKVLLGMVGALPNVLLQSVLAMISCFFFMIDGRKFLNWLNEKLPLDGDVRNKFYTSFQDTAISTIWATVAAAAAQSLLMLVSYLLLGVPGAFLAAGATFIFAWIPLVGSTPVWLIGAIYLFVNDSILKAVLMLVAGAFTGIIDNFIRPLVLKGRGDMHPLIALVSIFGGIQMFGILGVFFGPILMSVLLSLVDVWPLVARRASQSPEEQMATGLVTKNIPTNIDDIKKQQNSLS